MKECIHKHIMRNEEAYYKKTMPLSCVEVNKQHRKNITIAKATKQLQSSETVFPILAIPKQTHGGSCGPGVMSLLRGVEQVFFIRALRENHRGGYYNSPAQMGLQTLS